MIYHLINNVISINIAIIILILIPVSDNLHEAGYHTLTPVQMQVIPAVISRRNILVASSTGSGKSTQ